MNKKILAFFTVLVLILVTVFCIAACQDSYVDDTSSDSGLGTGSQDTGSSGGGSTDKPSDNPSSGSGGTVATGIVKPAAKYLRVESLENKKITIRFNAIGNDLRYEVRYSKNEITNENFDKATLAQVVVTGSGESKQAIINEIFADADNKWYIGVRVSKKNGDDIVYSDILTVRAGGIDVIKLDKNKVDVIYMGEVIKDATALIDEQSIADPYHNKSGIPTSKVGKYYWHSGELNPGSYVPHSSTSEKYGIILRPIIDLETEHYVDSIYLYYGVNTYPVQVNVSLNAANYDTLEAWDYSVNYTVDTLLSQEIATGIMNGKDLGTVTYYGKTYTLVKVPLGFNGAYEATASGKNLSVTFSQSTKRVIFWLKDGNNKTYENGKVEFEFEVKDDNTVVLYRTDKTNEDGSKIVVDSKYASVTIDPATGLPNGASFATEIAVKNDDGTTKKDEDGNIIYEYTNGGTYTLAEVDRAESGTYLATDAEGNQNLTVIVDGTVKDYKSIIFKYTNDDGKTDTLQAIYTIDDNNKIKFYADNRPAKQGWTRVEIKRVVRYVQIFYKDTEDWVGSVTSQAPTEVLVYGYQVGAGDPILDTTHDLPLMKDFMGACGFTAGGGGNTSPEQLACMGVLREYVNLGWVYSNAGFPKKAATIANSSMGDFDRNYGVTYKGLIIIPCLQWNEGSNPARYYDRIKEKLDISKIASEADKFKPETYAAYADVAYQYAARYGSSKIGYVFDAVAAHSGGTPKAGLNYLNWIELGNEPNGEDQNGTTPYQLAALTSAAYDGHQRTILTDVWNGEDFTYFFGAKNADPDFKVAMAGLAGIGSRYITSMVYWMKANRTDGCIAMDAFNVHTYFGQYFTLNGQQICVGVSPEQFGLVDAMSGLVEFRDKYYPDVEVWLTEFGWDTNESYETMTSSHSYADYSSREVQAMWLVRAYLLLAASGVDKATMYMVEDGTDDRTAVGKYGTCGIYACNVEDVYNEETGEWETIYKDGMIAKESYYLIYTLKTALGNMRFTREVASGNEDVWIYEFTGDNGERGYAVWCPTSNDTRVNDYKLYIGADGATLITNNFEDHREYKDQYGNPTDVEKYYQTTGDHSNLVAENGFVSINVTENPVYVIVD